METNNAYLHLVEECERALKNVQLINTEKIFKMKEKLNELLKPLSIFNIMQEGVKKGCMSVVICEIPDYMYFSKDEMSELENHVKDVTCNNVHLSIGFGKAYLKFNKLYEKPSTVNHNEFYNTYYYNKEPSKLDILKEDVKELKNKVKYFEELFEHLKYAPVGFQEALKDFEERKN